MVRLWEIDVHRAFESGEAGPLALVPLLRGGDEPSNVREAARRLDELPRPGGVDAMSVLIELASQRYDRDTFLNVLGKDRVMQSWIWQMGVDEGQIRNARQVCADLAREFHPAVATDVVPAIEACDQLETLRSWTLQCPKLSAEALVTLVTGKPPARAARSRATRPSRRSTKRR